MPHVAESTVAILPGIWMRHDPVVEPAPLVVDVSRSGREYPHEFRSPLPFTVLHDNASMYVEELFAHTPNAGGTLLFACFPNTFMGVKTFRRNEGFDRVRADLSRLLDVCAQEARRHAGR